MRKYGTWVYAALIAALLLLFSGFLLARRGGEPLEVRTGKYAAPVERSLPAAAEPQQGRINVNTADAAALEGLPGIGQTRAAAIIAFREEHGPFRSISDLMQVQGIGEGILNRIKDRICVEDTYENSDH